MLRVCFFMPWHPNPIRRRGVFLKSQSTSDNVSPAFVIQGENCKVRKRDPQVTDSAGSKAEPEKRTPLLNNPPNSPPVQTGSFHPRVAITAFPGCKAMVITSLVSLLLLTALPFFERCYLYFQSQNLTATSRQLIREYLLDMRDDDPPQCCATGSHQEEGK